MKKNYKLFMAIMIATFTILGMNAQETMTIEDVKIQPGETKEFAVNMNNGETQITSFEVKIVIPDELSFVTAYNDDYDYSVLTDRASGYTYIADILDNNTLYCVAYPASSRTAPFKGSEGAILTFAVKAKEDATVSQKEILLTSIVMNESDGTPHEPADYTSTLNIYKLYNVTVSVNENQGSVTGASEVESGNTITLTATANTGYHFVKWSDGVTDAEYTFAPTSDTTLTAEFAPNKYTVKFVAGGETVSEKELDYGTAITVPETTPTKTGYTFKGWGNVAETVPAENVTYTAEFTINQYKVTFIADGKTVSETSLDYGAAITAPEAPTKEGYTFSTWGDVAATVPANDVTYTAQYTVNQYKVAFVAEGATVKEETLDFGTAITAPEAPAKEGYTFKSWGEVAETVPAKDVTYTAEYTINTYKVTYMVDGVEYKSVDAEYGAALNAIEEPVKEGHTFSGWNGLPANMPATDVNVTGTFAVNQYKVTFVAEGATVKEETLDFGTAITAPEAPAKEGYTFKSWGEVAETVPAKDVTYTAEYTINTYKVTYMVDGVEYKSVDAEYGAALNAIEEPVKEGHTFSGWNGLPANMPATDVNVTGTFAINQYIITYYVGNDIWATDTYDFGATVTIRIYEPTETRYSFTGWEEESVETMPAHNIEYHTTLADGISNVFENNKPINVYTLSGNKIASNIMPSELSQILSKGIYIVNGKKVIVK